MFFFEFFFGWPLRFGAVLKAVERLLLLWVFDFFDD
jgi:hypothetical protein